jgi:hypothetical protein
MIVDTITILLDTDTISHFDDFFRYKPIHPGPSDIVLNRIDASFGFDENINSFVFLDSLVYTFLSLLISINIAQDPPGGIDSSRIDRSTEKIEDVPPRRRLISATFR